MKYRELKEIIKDNAAFKLPENRSFLEEAKSHYIPVLSNDRKQPLWHRLMVGFSLALFVVLLGSGLYLDFKITATVTVDINPSVELEINSFRRVRKVIPLNSDGEILVENLTYHSGSLSVVLSDILQTSEALGYSDIDDTALLFGVSGTKPEIEDGISEIISRCEKAGTSSYLIIKTHLMTGDLMASGYSITVTNSLTSDYDIWSLFGSSRCASEEQATTTTTTAAISTTTGNDTSSDSYNTYTPNYAFSGTINLETLSATYGITEAKMELILIIYATVSDYQTETGFQELLNMDLSELLALYLSE
ncbi:MAG TPA: hypothetical protein PLH02_00255 [Bacillota bacterium]|nr:hypothetical protein [Bacillota bacterium]HPQ61295.1 hypothetical protein [Bacillota bacterium]HRX91927.1 hypothetical protein [Candidatus Izemoplasmatales bacterium]